jgi:hypothetical protein
MQLAQVSFRRNPLPWERWNEYEMIWARTRGCFKDLYGGLLPRWTPLPLRWP